MSPITVATPTMTEDRVSSLYDNWTGLFDEKLNIARPKNLFFPHRVGIYQFSVQVMKALE